MADTNLATVETMWRREVEAAHTYKLLAEREQCLRDALRVLGPVCLYAQRADAACGIDLDRHEV